MPLSELYCMAKGKLGSNQQKTTNYSTDLSSIPDNDIVELVWENGQILTHGQSSRERKTFTSNSLPSYDLPSNTSKYREKDKGNGSNPKGEKFGSMDAILNDFSASVPSGEMGLSPNDDMVPWYNYSIDDSSLQQDYCSDFLTELSGVTVNELSNTQNDIATMEKKSYFTQTLRDSNSFSVSNGTSVEQGNASKVASELTRRSQFNPFLSQQCQTPFPSYRSRIADISSDNTIKAPLNAVSGDSALIQAPSSGSHSSKTQKQNSGPPNSGTGFINFSHFSRPAAMIAANNLGAVAGSSLSNIERRTCEEKGSAASSASPLESTFIDSNKSLQKETGSNSQPVVAPTNIDLKSGIAKPLEEPHPAEQSGAVSHADTSKNDKSPNQIGGSDASRGIPDGGKIIEPAVASSSVCSVNSVDRASNDPTHHLKRKCRDTEESDDPSEDIEEESVGAKKVAPARGGTGSKRSRAAEVHNLSERRRRDRINEKMRALQELIPNCNKVDKASMLDEAIEYLKTLQLQVQIMSMGTGLCMPPMMMPAGMQHMHAAHMAHFSAMGMGMGMGMGFGMSMVDVNGASPCCPIMQVPPMQAAHFPGPPIPGAPSLHGMAGSNLAMSGHHPGQGNPMSMPHSPLIPLSAGPPMKLAIGLNPAGPGGPMGNFNSAQASTLKDPVQQTNVKVMQNTDTNSLMKTTSSQATKEG